MQRGERSMGGSLTLDDVAGIAFPSAAAFAPDGSSLGFLWNDGGRVDVWRAEHDGSRHRVSPGEGGVSGFGWAPSGSLAWIQNGRLYVDGVEREVGIEPLHALAWASGTDRLAVAGDRAVCVVGADVTVIDAGVDLGILNPGPSVSLRWSPDGRRLAVATKQDGRRGLTVIDTDRGTTTWHHTGEGFVTAFAWIDADLLHVTEDLPPLGRNHLMVQVSDGARDVLVVEEGHEVIGGAGAHACPVAPVVAPDGTRVVYTLYRDRWAHLYSLDLASRELSQLTYGDHDDYGGDRVYSPCWDADADGLVFCSSRGDHKQRHLWRYRFGGGSLERLTSAPGTNHAPVICHRTGRLAFVHAGPSESPDIWVMDRGDPSPRQVTHSMPRAWERTATVAPIHVAIPTGDGMTMPADLFLPVGFDPSRHYPVLVFVHGGTIDQMRYGWHPGPAYLGPYAWHQYLLQHGYAVLSIDYRGTAGYGLDYQMSLWGRMGVADLADCVAAATWLRSQDWVAPDRLAIWGISYGGYLTLTALTKAPGTFAAGICVAGVWDWEAVREQRAAADLCLSLTGRYRMLTDLTGEDAERARIEASPRNFASQLEGHLLVMHGTGDRKVTSDQMDSLVADCVALGKPVDVMYYPGEAHVFTGRATWRDAYRRMKNHLDRHLGPAF
ncbi:MAG TPA: prolyl oligopeptidase family serine peptidase [Acidimicrobiia bacterium]|nr:prolyl oligopeptidase family serine peptidase [Acidimicrobiia bacterium]